MEKILDEYRKSKYTLDEFKSRITDLLKTVLRDNRINYHQITSRLKEEGSLMKKMESKNGKYNALSDITDVVGLRIITYFEDEVDQVAKIITEEFDVDLKNSIDKRITDANKFGYKSLHYVIKCKTNRTDLSEWRKFKDVYCEIQIRSILQHAWAEIEHDIGYKSQSAVPEQEKRNFFRIAALLETADKEFVRLRTNLNRYEQEVPALIKNAPEDVLIDKASLTSYLDTSEIVKNVDSVISKNTQTRIRQDDMGMDALLDKLKFMGIKTIKELDESLKQHKEIIIYLATDWLGTRLYDEVIRGISVFYLPYSILAEKGDRSFAEKYFAESVNAPNPASETDKLFRTHEKYKTSH